MGRHPHRALNARTVQAFIRDPKSREVLNDLKLMNITRASLYPGLDGFAQSLKYSLEIEDERLG
jgi:hypothetical protein